MAERDLKHARKSYNKFFDSDSDSKESDEDWGGGNPNHQQLTVIKNNKKMAARCMKVALMVAEAAKKAREGFINYFDLEVSQPFHDSSQQQTSDLQDSSESSDTELGGGNPNHQIRSDKDDEIVDELDHNNDKERRQKSAAKKKK